MNELTTNNGIKWWATDQELAYFAGSIVDHTLFSKDSKLSQRLTIECVGMMKDGSWWKSKELLV